ncbi:MAG: transcription elongation factor GreA [Anaerolineae bacterium]|nr:transcription elongation factor GreA [Anaerolineae bacterium]
MADEQQFLTAQGAAELRAELENLINVRRPRLAALLKEAISQGDLSENADYTDAKEQQAFLEGRIRYLENLLRVATILDDRENGKAAGLVQPGVEVTVQMDGESPETYRIVGAAEADPRSGKISNESPLGAALLGRRVGDAVRVQTPGGVVEFQIVHIAR